MIGGMSGIDKNVLPFSLAIGNRAKLRGLNLVGIRRHKFNKDQIIKINNLHKNLHIKEVSLSNHDKVESIFHEYKSVEYRKFFFVSKTTNEGLFNEAANLKEESSPV